MEAFTVSQGISTRPSTPRHALLAFVAGFIAVLAFHQPMLMLLAKLGVTHSPAYALNPVGVLAIPKVISLSFWGGVWGIVMFVVGRRWQIDGSFYIKALLFGMIAPTLVAWYVVAPLKGLPVAAGYAINGMATGLCVNAAWGLGTAILLRLMQRSLQPAA
ncbi:MAG: hypothetical protein JWR21_310 [Herminiimonas sp.]|nr:hypothetical protein [Herminiimonas sp.]MDB5851992.1 hypothetical protein [Herminiimonas sp.]